MHSLLSSNYKNEFIAHFKGEDHLNNLPRQTPGVLYSKALPTSVSSPELRAWNDELADKLQIKKPSSSEEIEILSGNKIAPGMKPYAARYGGHQFGHWAGQLGDGRAITLGEWVDPDNYTWEFQLKGAGPTPYSRRADGRAVLRSSVREYLMSEAMHYLGVPTTRALSMVTTGDQVMRDMFYNGNPRPEPGAIVLRVAPSFLRFGNFEILAAYQEKENLEKLVDWTITRYHPHLSGENRILRWFEEVVERTATMIVEWLRVGFVHGVMNTDNMSVLGLTIDYGPFSFLDNYDPGFTPNTTDLPGRRYAYGRQASIAYWNLGCLANALVPIITETVPLEKLLHGYEEIISEKYQAMMASKLGLDKFRQEDHELIDNLENMLSSLQPDMTIFYQLLEEISGNDLTEDEMNQHFKESFYDQPSPENHKMLLDFIFQYKKRLEKNQVSAEQSKQAMQKANPKFILRNYLLHQAIEEMEQGNDNMFQQLQKAITDPYSKASNKFIGKRPEWATSRAGCSMLSCSS